jgi:hypothetical protein
LISEAKTSIENTQTPKESTPPDQSKVRPASLSMGTLKAFPLPAPTRPLPSLPEAERSSGPQIPGSRPATALGNVDAGGSIADDEESLFTPSISDHSKSMSPAQYTTRRRAASIRIPHMQGLPKSPSSAGEGKGQPLADSPILGHSTPTKPQSKRIILNGLQINSQVGRKNLPFGLPSPPPTASLPSAPPPSHPPPPPPGRAAGQRNYTAPNAALLQSKRSMEAPLPPGSYRNSMISRSDSSGSSLRHESFPDSYQESRPGSRPESPLPSSDDEVFGPSAGVKVSRRQADKQKAAQPTHRGRTMETRHKSSHSHPRHPHSARNMIQSRSNPNLETTTPPQSQNSMSTYRSRESQSSHRPQASSKDHYLEDRVANLERQNQILQAALMAALNAGNKNPLEGLLDPTMMPPFPSGPFANHYPPRHTSRPESWVSSSRSSEHSGFDIASSCREGRPNVKQLDNMIEDIESGWISDKSSRSGALVSCKR